MLALLNAVAEIRTLIVVQVFDRTLGGELVMSGEPAHYRSESRARSRAVAIADRHAGVVAWSRPDTGENEAGPTTILFKRGDIPELME